MFQDFKELLSILNDSSVKYLVVGGYAVSFHAQPRATKDLEILIKPDAQNAAAVFTALNRFGAPLEGLGPDDLIERGKFFRLGAPPVMVDILPEIGGVDFDGAWQRRVEVVIDSETGLTAHFISEADLISSKLAAGRPQDLADADALHRARTRSKGSTGPQRDKQPTKASRLLLAAFRPPEIKPAPGVDAALRVRHDAALAALDLLSLPKDCRRRNRADRPLPGS